MKKKLYLINKLFVPIILIFSLLITIFINTQAQDQKVAGIFREIDQNLLFLLKSGELTPKPLMVCGGGTSSNCAKE